MRPERFEIKRPEIPTGLGGEMNKEFHDWLLLFEKVKNKAVLVNKEVFLPLKLEEGKESHLGLFAKAALAGRFDERLKRTIVGRFADRVGLLKEKEISDKNGEKRLEGWPLHHRSALLGRAIFGDKQGRLYRDIDLKGSGFIWGKKIRMPGEDMFPIPGYQGFLDKVVAFNDYQDSEKLLQNDIRTSRALAIIELEEIIIKGEKISLEEARKRGIIKEGFEPVVEVRGFKNETSEFLKQFQESYDSLSSRPTK